MMRDETERSVELLERLLGDPQLRRRFRTDAAAVLTEAGLPELAAGLGHGGRALMTLEMRESRSSLANGRLGAVPHAGARARAVALVKWRTRRSKSHRRVAARSLHVSTGHAATGPSGVGALRSQE